MTKVVLKSGERVIATRESVVTMIKDNHVSIGHKGEWKTHKKILENYSNVSRALVSEFIKNCERCVEKMRKKEITAGIVVKPILADFINERG